MRDPLRIRVPSSKSLTQRALVLAALGGGRCEVLEPLDCDDSRVLVGGLRALGCTVDTAASCCTVTPPARLAAPRAPLLLGNAGTAVRFLTGLSLLVPGTYVIDGTEAMRRRPMPALLETLSGVGVVVEELGLEACPPVRLTGLGGGSGERLTLRLRAGSSSQELSALLLAGAGLGGGIRIEVKGSLPSRPYVKLTLAALRAFGVEASAIEADPSVYEVWGGPPRAARFRIEGDWSSASYPLAAGFLTGRPVEVENLDSASEQADRVFPALLAELARPGPRTLNLRDCPDLAPTLVAVALFADGETVLTGAAHLRIKESDRIGVTARELHKLGADVEEREDGLRIRPRALHGAALDPAGDHRLAMAFGLVSLRVPGLEVRDRGCVSKSYPDFWSMLARFQGP